MWRAKDIPDQIVREGELEKRSDSLLQLWKKKRCLLTPDRLCLYSGKNYERLKELRFHSILKLDSVEHTRKHVYFTIVTTNFKEIDFRCTRESCWNSSITLALIEYQNRLAAVDMRQRSRRAWYFAHEDPEDERSQSSW